MIIVFKKVASKIFLDRCLSEDIFDMIDEDRIEEVLSEIEKNNSLLDIRARWDHMSQQSDSDVFSSQFTKLYAPQSAQQFLVARENSAAVEQVSEWMRQWRKMADSRKDVS